MSFGRGRASVDRHAPTIIQPLASHTSSSCILAGDIGGTKTLLGLYAPAARPVPITVRRFATDPGSSLDALVTAFLNDVGPHEPVAVVALGVAGPIVGGRARLTNHPWTIDGAAIGRALGAPVHLLNDLEALAYSLDALQAHEVAHLHEGLPDSTGPKAVIAAGTGLGQAVLLHVGGQPVAWPSEGGHADFSPRSPREDELVRMLRARHGRATVERVLSGPGLVNLHRLTHADAPCEATRGLNESDMPAAISTAALGRQCPGCQEALELFVSAFGSEAGNLALRTLATGGLYVGGGIAPRLESALRSQGFLDAFLGKPPMESLLDRIPVRLITAEDAGLLGAAVAAQRHLR
jgi:glucokinase